MSTSSTKKTAGTAAPATDAGLAPVRVKLAKPHTHLGRECRVGETITVEARQVTWLEELGVIESVSAPPAEA